MAAEGLSCFDFSNEGWCEAGCAEAMSGMDEYAGYLGHLEFMCDCGETTETYCSRISAKLEMSCKEAFLRTYMGCGEVEKGCDENLTWEQAENALCYEHR